MKSKLSTAIAALTLAGLSQGAHAIAPNVTPDIEVYMAGASAQDKAIRSLFVNLCGAPNAVNLTGGSQSNDLTIFNIGTNHSAYFCTLKAYNAATNPNGVKNLTVNGVAVPEAKVLFHKRSAGGSAQGVNPLISGTAIAHMPVNATNCPGAAVVGADGQSTIACTGTTNVASEAGISDVEPGLFVGANVPFGSTAVASTANITIQPAAALLFGVPVTTNLYVALQKAQGLLNAPSSCIAGDYSEACMPSLTKEQVATLTTGSIKKWSEFKIGTQTLVEYARDASKGPTQFAELDAPGVLKDIASATTFDDKFHYCKRVDGSGTNAVHNVVYLHNPCMGANSPATEGDWASSTLNGPVKHEVSGSGDMEKCLSDFSDATNTGTQQNASPDLGNFTAAVNSGLKTAWAIGQQSLENNAGAIPAKHYRFVKIDGVAPTLQNAYSGKYAHWSEPTYQWRNDASADKKAVIQKIATDAASPSILASDLNPGFVHAFGQSGYLANGNNYATGNAFNLASPVMPFTHAANGATLSNCRVPVQQRNHTVVPANGTNRPIL